MTVTVKDPLTRATPSLGHQPPMLRHIVDRGDLPRGVPSAETAALLGLPSAPVEPQATTLCGEPWDRLGISPDGPLCGPCRAEYVRRHPTRPLPGGAT